MLYSTTGVKVLSIHHPDFFMTGFVLQDGKSILILRIIQRITEYFSLKNRFCCSAVFFLLGLFGQIYKIKIFLRYIILALVSIIIKIIVGMYIQNLKYLSVLHVVVNIVLTCVSLVFELFISSHFQMCNCVM